MCRTFPALAALCLLLATTPAAAARTTLKSKPPTSLPAVESFERPDAQKLVGEAKTLWHGEQDYTGALAKFNAAVDADPNDSDIRLQRGHFFEALSRIVVPEDQDKFKARAQVDYEHITDIDPDSLVAGMARDGLTRLAGETYLEPRAVMCPESAVEVHTRADSLYGARKYGAAAAEYQKAAGECPEAASWWVDLADAHYVQEDYERARELFLKALTVDPWNREAHRFLADTELQLSHGEAAIHQLVLTVVSDPVYEGGWSALRTYATAMGRKWNRVYGNRKTELKSVDGASWGAYKAAKASVSATQEGATSALAVERAAVRSALEAARTMPDGTKGAGSFWSMMSRAERAGYLDEAIFIHMLDSDLAAEYPQFREKNAQRLASYLETVIME